MVVATHSYWLGQRVKFVLKYNKCQATWSDSLEKTREKRALIIRWFFLYIDCEILYNKLQFMCSPIKIVLPNIKKTFWLNTGISGFEWSLESPCKVSTQSTPYPNNSFKLKSLNQFQQLRATPLRVLILGLSLAQEHHGPKDLGKCLCTETELDHIHSRGSFSDLWGWI